MMNEYMRYYKKGEATVVSDILFVAYMFLIGCQGSKRKQALAIEEMLKYILKKAKSIDEDLLGQDMIKEFEKAIEEISIKTVAKKKK